MAPSKNNSPRKRRKQVPKGAVAGISETLRKQSKSALSATGRALAQAKRARERADDKALHQQARELERLGLYDRKKKLPRLTPYQRKRVRSGQRELSKFRDEGYSIAKFPPKRGSKRSQKREVKELRALAKRHGYELRKRAVIVPSGGAGKQVRPARLRYNKDFKGFVISTEHITKDKQGNIYKRRQYTPLVPSEALKAQLDRLDRKMKNLPKLNANQRLTFIFPNGNMSDTFSNLRLMMERIETYGRTERGIARLLDVLTVVVMEKQKDGDFVPTGDGFTMRGKFKRDLLDKYMEGGER